MAVVTGRFEQRPQKQHPSLGSLRAKGKAAFAALGPGGQCRRDGRDDPQCGRLLQPDRDPLERSRGRQHHRGTPGDRRGPSRPDSRSDRQPLHDTDHGGRAACQRHRQTADHGAVRRGNRRRRPEGRDYRRGARRNARSQEQPVPAPPGPDRCRARRLPAHAGRHEHSRRQPAARGEATGGPGGGHPHRHAAAAGTELRQAEGPAVADDQLSDHGRRESQADATVAAIARPGRPAPDRRSARSPRQWRAGGCRCARLGDPQASRSAP